MFRHNILSSLPSHSNPEYRSSGHHLHIFFFFLSPSPSLRRSFVDAAGSVRCFVGRSLPACFSLSPLLLPPSSLLPPPTTAAPNLSVLPLPRCLALKARGPHNPAAILPFPCLSFLTSLNTSSKYYFHIFLSLFWECMFVLPRSYRLPHLVFFIVSVFSHLSDTNGSWVSVRVLVFSCFSSLPSELWFSWRNHVIYVDIRGSKCRVCRSERTIA